MCAWFRCGADPHVCIKSCWRSSSSSFVFFFVSTSENYHAALGARRRCVSRVMCAYNSYPAREQHVGKGVIDRESVTPGLRL